MFKSLTNKLVKKPVFIMLVVLCAQQMAAMESLISKSRIGAAKALQARNIRLRILTGKNFLPVRSMGTKADKQDFDLPSITNFVDGFVKRRSFKPVFGNCRIYAYFMKSFLNNHAAIENYAKTDAFLKMGLLSMNPQDEDYDRNRLKEFTKSYVILNQLKTACKMYDEHSNNAKPVLSEHPQDMSAVESALKEEHALPFKLVDIKKTKVVKQGEWELLHTQDSHYDSLVTSPLKPCCAIAVFNNDTQTLGMYHTDWSVSSQGLLRFFTRIAPNNNHHLQIKIITYTDPETAHATCAQYPESLAQHMIKTILWNTIEKVVQPVFTNISFLPFNQSDLKHQSDSDSPIFAPAIVKKNNSVTSLDQFEKYFSLIGLASQLSFNFESNVTEDLNDNEIVAHMRSIDQASFGITKARSIFSTNYPMSLCAFRPSDLKTLLYFPYLARTHAVVPPKNERSVYDEYSIIKK